MEFGNLLNYLKVIDPLAANGCIRLKGTLNTTRKKQIRNGQIRL